MNTTVKDAAPSHTVPLPAIKEIWCGLLVVCLLTAPLRAATNLVTTTADNGPGTLRQLITDAAAGDTLMFGVAGTITLTSGELVLAQDLRIIGPGPTNLILSGNSASRILRVNSNVVAFLSGLTFRNGKAANGITGTVIDDSYITPGGPGQPGGAIYAEGIMTLQNCCVISNSAGNGGYGFGNDLFGVSAGGDGGAGGGIYNSGDLTLNKCEVAGNRAGSGGISGDGWTYSPTSGIGGSGGGICNSGILRLTDSVVSGNTAGRGGDTPRESTGGSGGNGGGVRNAGNFVATGSIISSNSAGNGGRGGVDSLDGGDGGSGGNGGGVFSSGTLAQTNCLINGNRCGNAGDGGAGYIGLGGNGGVGGSGGGLHASGSNVRLVNSWIVDNQAGFGGAGATGGMGDGAPGPDGEIGPYESEVKLVPNCTEQALQTALADGGMVRFACDGSIVLSNTLTITDDTFLDANGHRVTVDGNNMVRVFHVQTNVFFRAENLIIAQGQSTEGGGLYNDGGVVTFLGVTLVSNVATNASGHARGGAVFNVSGTIHATNCVFVLNMSKGGSGQNATGDLLGFATSGGTGMGGAVCNLGVFNASQCTFERNIAIGGTGGSGLCYAPPPWENPEPVVYDGASGGDAEGGAVCNRETMIIERSLMVSNAVVGGTGGAGAVGAWNGWPCSTKTPGSWGGTGGNATGAALFNDGPGTLLNCTLAWNSAAGGTGTDGGQGIQFVCHGGGQTQGGGGGNGGNGVGVIYNDRPILTLTHCTLAHNSGQGGSGGTSGGSGYWIYWNPPDSTNQFVVLWPAPPDGLSGIGGGGINPPGSMAGSLLASNQPANGDSSLASADLGHNLSSDDSCMFTNAGSLNSTDPKLAPLFNHGGPTLTLALLPGSPAIDAGDTASAPSTDQRGIPRPYGLAADIGAFEYWLTAKAIASPTGGVDIMACGISGQECCLQVSTNLTTWMTTATNEISADGTALFHDNTPSQSIRFYRLMLR